MIIFYFILFYFLLGEIKYGNSVANWTDYGIAVRRECDVSSVVNGSAKIGKLY